MPTISQYRTVEQQCKSLEIFGYKFNMDIELTTLGAIPKIILWNRCKSYRFSDPDWDVVIKQISHLYCFMKQKHSLSA